MSSKLFLMGSSGEEKYWWSSTTLSAIAGSNPEAGHAIFASSFGDVYVSCKRLNVVQGMVRKLSKDGECLWTQRVGIDYTVNTNAYSTSNVVEDSLGNLYVVYQGTPSGSQVSTIFKFDPEGNILAQKMISRIGYNIDHQGINDTLLINDSNEIYLVGYSLSVGSNSSAVAKVTPTINDFTLNWIRSTPADGFRGRNGCLDSAQNIIFTSDTNSITSAIVSKMTPVSSGNLVWRRRDSGESYGRSAGVCVDQDNNVYSAHSPSSVSIPSSWITKFDSNGTPIWRLALSVADEIVRCRGISINTSGDIIVVGYVTGYHGINTQAGFVAAIDRNTGQKKWSNVISVGAYTEINAVYCKDNVMYLTGHEQTVHSKRSTFTLKVPDDGTMTGTYGDLVYALTHHIDTTNPAVNNPTQTISATTVTPVADPGTGYMQNVVINGESVTSIP